MCSHYSVGFQHNILCIASSKVPESYHYSRRRIHQYDTSRPPGEPRSLDTSDLEVNEEDWFSDEAAATLLGYAEMEVRGHKVSQIFITVGKNIYKLHTSADEGD